MFDYNNDGHLGSLPHGTYPPESGVATPSRVLRKGLAHELLARRPEPPLHRGIARKRIDSESSVPLKKRPVTPSRSGEDATCATASSPRSGGFEASRAKNLAGAIGLTLWLLPKTLPQLGKAVMQFREEIRQK